MKPNGYGRLSFIGLYSALFVILGAVALWLGLDLADGRNRIIQDRMALAVQKSQFMSQWFGTTVVSVDYVLRDILDRVTVAAVNNPTIEPEQVQQWSTLLADKLKTIPDTAGISLFNSDCVFIAAADPAVIGFRSNQRACRERGTKLENRNYIQYVPAEKSASKRPVLLISRYYPSPDGHLLGGALAAVNIGYVQDWISAFEVNASDILAVVDSDNILLGRNPPMPGAIGKVIGALNGLPALRDGRSSAGFLGISPLDGRRRIYGASRIDNVPLMVMVGFDMERSLTEWWRRALQLFGGFGVLAVLSVMALRTHLTAIHQREEMRALATTDSLTGVANRRQLVLTGEQEVARSTRYGDRMSLLMVDIDRFKAINDTWGHPTGDRVIQALSTAMVAALREQDVVGRLGGEEFAAVLPETDRQGAMMAAERLREMVEDAVAVDAGDGRKITFTISVGVATLTPNDDAFQDVLSRADKALYAAKCDGRNRVATV